MFVPIIIIVVLTLAVFIYVFFLLRKEKTNLFLRIVLSMLYGGMVVCTYGVGVYGIIQHYANIHRFLDNYMPIGGGVSIGFMWLLTIIGLFLLRQFFGAVLSREDTCWLSD